MQTVVPNILALEAIILAISMATRNVIVERKQNQYFIKSSVILVITTVCETLSIFLDGHTSGIAIFCNNLVNVLCFALPPIMIMMLLFMRSSKNTAVVQYLAVLCGVNAVVAVSSPFTHILFGIGEDGYYYRGFLNPMTMLLCMLILARLIYTSYRYFANAARAEKYFLTGIFVVGISGALLQMIFEGVLCMDLGIAMTYLLYYAFNMELVLRYDSVTGLKNRGCFNKDMELMEEKEHVCIFMGDMNYLKRMNDSYGHQMGDRALEVVADILSSTIGKAGNLYRIGGDEFCALCQDVTEEQMKNCVLEMEKLEEKRNKTWNQAYKLSIAYGYAFYEKSSGKKLHDTFVEADKNMYMRKKEMKQKDHPLDRVEDGR